MKKYKPLTLAENSLGGMTLVKLRIKELAQERGLKQYELAQKSGVTPQLLNRYWNNSMQRVSLEHLAMIAKVLGVEAGDLIVPDGDSKIDSQDILPEAA